MFDVQDLKSIAILNSLNDNMLKKMLSITEKINFKEGEYVFKEGKYAEYLYAVIDGKVALEIEKTSGKAIRIGDVFPNFSFGISSVVDTDVKQWLTDARALKNTTVFRWKTTDLEKLFHEDFEFGFLFLKRIGKALKTRLQMRDAQLADGYSS